ncbi:MAG: hypothetical protein HN348_20410 [Proteobacteria bacterium]|jgi:hypothetical protein|nr:hypothetical protein [Pseudomonadota bacterium]
MTFSRFAIFLALSWLTAAPAQAKPFFVVQLPDLECWGIIRPNVAPDTFMVRVTNNGNATAPSTWLDVFTSTNSAEVRELQLGDTSDTYVRTKQLAPGQSVEYTFPIPIDVLDDALQQQYPMVYEACIVDTYNRVSEWSEEDNVGWWYDQIFPDLLDD